MAIVRGADNRLCSVRRVTFAAMQHDVEMKARVIQVRPSRNPRWQKEGGWEVYEGSSLCCVYLNDRAREHALSHARQRATYRPCEIQVLDDAWNVIEVIGNEDKQSPG